MPSLVPRPCGGDAQLQPNLPSNLGVLAQRHKGDCQGLPLAIASPWVFAPSLPGPLSMYFIFFDTIIIHLPICGHSNALCYSNVLFCSACTSYLQRFEVLTSNLSQIPLAQASHYRIQIFQWFLFFVEITN
jgi:hypothetical protein